MANSLFLRSMNYSVRKQSWDPSVYPDLHQKLMGSILSQDPSDFGGNTFSSIYAILPPDPRHHFGRYLFKNQYLSGNCWDISLWLLTRATLHSLLFETDHVNSIASHNIPGADRTSGTSVHVGNVNILSNTVWVDLCVWLKVKVTSLSSLNPSPGAKFPQCLWVLSALPSPLRYTSLWVCVCVYVDRDASVFLSL